jgi:hypothetical protein
MTALSQDVVVVDLDSTLADTRQRHFLSPTEDDTKTWEDYAGACENDVPIEGSVALVRLLYPYYFIYILTGRDGSARVKTEAWLEKNRIPYDLLRMREIDDVEGNGLYKSREIAKMRDMGYNVRLFMDDWPEVCESVEIEGTPSLCVNPRYIDLSMKGYAELVAAQIDNPAQVK